MKNLCLKTKEQQLNWRHNRHQEKTFCEKYWKPVILWATIIQSLVNACYKNITTYLKGMLVQYSELGVSGYYVSQSLPFFTCPEVFIYQSTVYSTKEHICNTHTNTDNQKKDLPAEINSYITSFLTIIMAWL